MIALALSIATLQGVSAARLTVSGAPIQVWDLAVDPGALALPDDQALVSLDPSDAAAPEDVLAPVHEAPEGAPEHGAAAGEPREPAPGPAQAPESAPPAAQPESEAAEVLPSSVELGPEPFDDKAYTE